MTRLAAAIAVVILAALPAAAQRPLLDLSPQERARPPAPGTGAAALGLAQELTFQADALHRTGDPHERARAALRRVGAALLTTGERAGVQGSERVLLGRTLADRLAELDDLVGRIGGPGGGARLQMIEADALAAARALDAPGADPRRALREALAVLAGEGAEAEREPPLAGRAAAWGAMPGVEPGLERLLRELDGGLSAGERWVVHRPAALELRRVVIGAGEGLSGLPAWVPGASRQPLGAEFSRAVRGLLERETQAEAIARLERLARLAAVASRVDALDDSPAGERVRTAFAQHLGALPPETPTTRRTLDAFDRALVMAQRRARADEDRGLVRPLRPAWRALLPAARQSEQHLLTALPALLRAPGAMSDPGILATLNSAQRALADLRLLERLSLALSEAPAAGREPEVREEYRRLADRVLRLGQDLSKPGLRDDALRSLRELGEGAAALLGTPPGGGPASPELDALTGGRTAALHARLAGAPGAWVSAVEKGQAGQSELAAGRLLNELAAALEALAALGPASLPDLAAGYERLLASPDWQLSGEALAELLAGAPEAASEATRLVLDGAPEAGAALVKLRADYSAALLAGRLALERGGGAAAAGAGGAGAGAGGAGPLAPVLELVTTDAAFTGEQREAFAIIGRYGEEAAVARRTGATSDADAARAYVNDAAARLESLGP